MFIFFFYPCFSIPNTVPTYTGLRYLLYIHVKACHVANKHKADMYHILTFTYYYVYYLFFNLITPYFRNDERLFINTSWSESTLKYTKEKETTATIIMYTYNIRVWPATSNVGLVVVYHIIILYTSYL